MEAFIYALKWTWMEVSIYGLYYSRMDNLLMHYNGLKVFENMVLRRIFGPKRDEVRGEWRKLHNEELHILYSSPNIIRQIKSRRKRRAGHVARMREESVQGFGGKARRKETTWKTKA
jgi:hypothetical protein